MIVVDAGHGGADPGGSGNGITEKDYTLKMSNYMLDRFKQLGAQVKATRTTDETLTPQQRVQRILNAFGNKSDVVVLSNHLNIGGGDGAEVVYALRDKDTLSKLILEELAASGQNTRKWYQRRLPSNTSKDYYFIHRDTGVTEPVLIEYGFMDNTTDANLIKNHWRELAEATVRAVSTYQRIPYKPPSGTVTTGNTYTVRSGDSLYSIAKKFNISVDTLKTANNLTSNMLSIGQVLTIPTGGTTPSGGTYTVQKGDSLWTIAQKFDTTVTEIKNLNNITSDLLSVGQVLTIPGATTGPSPDTYTVRAGDSLYSIASRFNTTADELKRLNNLTTNTLSIGQVLVLPTNRQDTIYSYNYDNINPDHYLEQPSFNTTPHTVEYGDTLWSIANLYNVSVSEIRSINNLMSNQITVGQVLLIPIKKPLYNVHEVQPGDDLWNIARKYNTTVEELKKLNGLTSDFIMIGQQIKLPL